MFNLKRKSYALLNLLSIPWGNEKKNFKFSRDDNGVDGIRLLDLDERYHDWDPFCPVRGLRMIDLDSDFCHRD